MVQHREKLGYIALGGVLMLVGMLTAVLFSPIGAQSESNANFDTITCRQLDVMGRDGTKAVQIVTFEGGGVIRVLGRDGEVRAQVYGSESGGHVAVHSRTGKNAGVTMLAADGTSFLDVGRPDSHALIGGDGSIGLLDGNGNSRIIAASIRE